MSGKNLTSELDDGSESCVHANDLSLCHGDLVFHELDDGNESRVHANDLSPCHGELVFHDFQSQHVMWIAPSRTYHVNAVDVSYYLDVCCSYKVNALNWPRNCRS